MQEIGVFYDTIIDHGARKQLITGVINMSQFYDPCFDH